MKCVIAGQNASILARAIQSFARIGNELFLEAGKDGLSIRTVNTTKSAFASILFHTRFFVDFQMNTTTESDENQCKLSMKSCLGVFRNMKQVQSCSITLDTTTHKLIIQLICRLETVKTHSLSILEHETLKAVYTTDKVSNTLVAKHKLFADIVSNFKINEEELTIEGSADRIIVKNYVEGTDVDNRFVRSQLTLKPDEFESFKITENTTITFCMRELRAILNFAEAQNINVVANFETGGRPVVFVLKNDVFEANLVMSTLQPDDASGRSMEQTSNEVRNLNISSTSTTNRSIDNTNSNGGLSILGKRNRIVSQPDGSEMPRCNRLVSEDLFPFDKDLASEILSKRRKTTMAPSANSGNSLGQPFVPSVESVIPDHGPAPSGEDEEVAIVFVDESESISLLNDDEAANEMALGCSAQNMPRRKGRDHRVILGSVFDRCRYSPSTQREKSVFADCSDEE